MSNNETHDFQPSTRRWGIVLAGGDGTRLQEFTRSMYGEARPKQFCALVGSESLLGQTMLRTQQSIRTEQLLVALKNDHKAFYDQECRIPPRQRVVQPSNLGTAPAILLCLMSISSLDREALVAILPADHHFEHDGVFRVALERAFDLAGKMTESVVLLGAAASRPEVEYGWIEAGACISPALKDVCRVRGFREKPGLDEAKILLQQGGLWNTFVMVGHVGAFRSLVKSTTDDAIDRFRFWPLWSRKELVVPAPAYDGLRTIDFSRDVLAPNPSRLVTLKLSDSGWTDLGQPDRVIAARQEVHRGLTSESGIHEDPNRDARHVSVHA